MKNLYQITRHLVWLTQFGLSVALPPVLFLLGAVWLKNEFAPVSYTHLDVYKRQHLGTVQLSSGGEVLASFPISAAQGVDALSFRYCFGRLVDSLLLYQGDFVQNK